MMTPTELRKKDLKTLMEELEKARANALAARLSVKMDQDKKSHEIHKNKRYIAQILTVMNEMSAQEKTPEPSEA